MGLFSASPSGSLTVASGPPGAIKQALNQSGWIAGEVIAAGQLQQGNPPSTFGLVTGTALVELARRRSKALPRHFVLAATADQVVAFKVRSLATGGETGPELLRISPGACASWPRATVRLLDLADGARSPGATLEMDAERFPVQRPNLDRDPNTDELIELLGGLGNAAAPSVGHDLRAAGDLSAGAPDELAADARRGRPDVDLSGWAGRRGLSFRGGTSQGGHLGVTCPWSEDLLFNVVRGRWPGGTHGVVCHEVRLLDIDTDGFFHGADPIGPRDGVGAYLLDAIVPLPIGGGRTFFKVPYTSAGTRVPHLARLTGLHVARVAEQRIGAGPPMGSWQERRLELGRQGSWLVRVRKHSDERTVDALLEGPIRELLSVQQGLGFEVRIEYGQAIVSRQDFVARDEQLDELVAAVEALAAGVREICVPGGGSRPLATPIPPPPWLAAVRRRPREKHTLWPPGARLEKLVAIADARAMAIEDPRAFHATFPELNVPGEAFGVLHGRLPGTLLTGRLLCCAERPMALPDDVRKLLHNPGGAVGCDVAVVAVDTGVAPTPPEGESDGDLRVAVADGVLTAWRVRRSWQADGDALDRLAADVAAVVSRRSLA